ncbi:hypothetical protein [Roseiconus lacunae]|uniref:Uncharacterized protein n=1 Tax=Roseiconus lacunae TaxID=2605694 RepID=A0ABT7PDN8_9BACT|nr:hypothetical protein [Roseiconus lacunae]MDM4014620.1 hypothetical protein [Roseiconus lacunae]
MSVIGTPMIVDGSPVIVRAGRSSQRFAAWADDWSGRALTLEVSANKVHWTYVDGIGAITEDTILDGLTGALYYRLRVESGDLQGVGASIAEVD